jgi:hypothetical protein
MTDRKLTAITSTQAIVDTDLWATVQDMATTPVTKGKEGTYLKQWLYKFPDGTMFNGRLAPSVSSNNLTLALKTFAGTDPSATNPVHFVIGGVVRSITSALSVTKNAATNWCNLGSAENGTKENDLFVYLGYNATDGVVIGFSRIPYATLYSDFSATTTNEKYCAISTITTAAAGDNYVNIGRFAATLSLGAAYTWSVPTYTSSNLIHRPIFETRWMNWTSAVTPNAGSITTLGTITSLYKIRMDEYVVNQSIAITTNGTGSGFIKATYPLDVTNLYLYGSEPAIAAKVCQIQVASGITVAILFYDSTYPGSNGATIKVRGSVKF